MWEALFDSECLLKAIQQNGLTSDFFLRMLLFILVVTRIYRRSSFFSREITFPKYLVPSLIFSLILLLLRKIYCCRPYQCPNWSQNGQTKMVKILLICLHVTVILNVYKKIICIGIVQNFYWKIVGIGQYRRLLILMKNVKTNIMQRVWQIQSKVLIARMIVIFFKIL